MRSKNLTLISTITLFIIGCGQKPEKASDRWGLKEPMVIAAQTEKPIPFGQLNSKNYGAFSSNDKLEFKESSYGGIHLRIQTNCDGQTQQIKIPLERQFALLSFLPPTSLYASPSKMTEPLHCDFNFVATNSEGALHSFSIENMAIAVMPNRLDWGAENIHPENAHKFLITLSGDGELLLQCAQLHARLKTTGGPIGINQLLALAQANRVTPENFAGDRCQLVATRENGTEKGTVDFLSSYFEYTLQSPALRVSLHSAMDALPIKSDIRNFRIFVWEIYNSSAEERWLRLPIEPALLQIDSLNKPMMNQKVADYRQGFTKAKLQLQDANGKFLTSVTEASTEVYALPAKSRVYLSLTFAEKNRCIMSPQGMYLSVVENNDLATNRLMIEELTLSSQKIQSYDLEYLEDHWIAGWSLNTNGQRVYAKKLPRGKLIGKGC